jgi:molybdopterin-guanine dinucleotide biosynthesis protein
MNIPSPAISIVGRHNSGKTTLIEKLIAELVSRGLDVGSVKHHHHSSFDIDHPGKDSYRHRAAGASETVIASPTLLARIKSLDEEIDCASIVKSMPNHDVIIVEGYRKSGLPTIEIMRAGNQSDERVAYAFVEGAKRGLPLTTDFTQFLRGLPIEDEAKTKALIEKALETGKSVTQLNNEESTQAIDYLNVDAKLPSSETVAIATNIPEAADAAAIYGIPAFDINNISAIADFVQEAFARPHISVVIQAGGESRRMGRSKACVPFGTRPMICRLIDRVSPAADNLFITTNEGPQLQFLHNLYPALSLNLVPDECEDRGALPGLYTAVKAAKDEYVAVVACDMVLASAALIIAETFTMMETGADAVVPINKHGFEPFHAVYKKSVCLPVIEEALARGERRAQAFFDAIKVVPFSQAKVLEAEPMGGCFVNANTPEDLAKLEDMLLDEDFTGELENIEGWDPNFVPKRTGAGVSNKKHSGC